MYNVAVLTYGKFICYNNCVTDNAIIEWKYCILRRINDMMTNSKASKLLSLLLAAVICAFSFVSCDETKETETTETTATETVSAETDAAETEAEAETVELLDDNLGEWDFDGHTFRVLSGVHGTYPVDTFSVDETSAEVLDVALYIRNLKLEERFNIAFESEVLPDIFNVNDRVREIVHADVKDYDMLMQIDRYAIASAINGYLLNYYELPKIDLSREYWYQNLIEDLSVHGNLYFAAGYDNLVYTESVTHLLFNQNIVEQYGLENPFDLIADGKWTRDTFFEMCEAVTNDLDGNGSWEDTDAYGVVSINNMFWTNFWIADGIKLVDKNPETGDLYFSALNNEALYTICQDLAAKTQASDAIYVNKPITSFAFEGSNYNAAMAMFMGGNTLFCGASLITTLDGRAMESDFGIIPYPRTEEVAAGTPYYSRTFGGFPYVVPSNKNDSEKERTSVIMEALACESYNTVKPALFEKVFSHKVSRNVESNAMLEMIIENRITDLGETYFFDAVELPYESMFSGNKGSEVASMTQSMNKKATKTIEKYNEAFRELKEQREKAG